jgi:hypothetical protein
MRTEGESAIARGPHPIFRLFPSLTDVAFLMPMVFLFVRMNGAKSMLGDGDTGYHIRTGEWILANGRVPHQDLFSFTKAGQPWYAWEWLWDVCFAWLYQHGGLATVVTVSIVVISLTIALLFRLVSRRCDNPFLAIGATLLACAGTTIHWLARPHLFTLLFSVILLAILDRVERGRRRLLLAIPLLMVAWTNLHGGFLAGILILTAYAGGELMRALFTSDGGERRVAMGKAKWYLATLGACAAATLVNPYTYHLHEHIYRFFTESYHFDNINEFQSISFHGLMGKYLECILLLGAVSAGWLMVKNRNFTALLLVAGWGHLALYSARNIPILAIAAAPIMAQALNEMLAGVERGRVAGWLRRSVAGFRNTALDFGETDGIWRVHALSIAGAALVALLLASPNATGKLKAEYDPQRYPSKALALLKANPDARIFTDDEWGDYLIFNLYPAQKVFVDGRSDFYGQAFEEKYLDLMRVKYDWEQTLDQYNIDTVVLSPSAALASTIKESSQWRSVYDDTVAIVFKRVSKSAPGQQKFSTAISGGKGHDPRAANWDRRNLRVSLITRTKGV